MSAQARDMLIPMKPVSSILSDTEPLIFVGFGGARPFDTVSRTTQKVEHIKRNDFNQTFDVLSMSRVFPDGTIEKWQYYARKDGHFLLEKGIIFDGGALSSNFVDSESDSEEGDEDSSGDDDSQDDSEDDGESKRLT